MNPGLGTAASQVRERGPISQHTEGRAKLQSDLRDALGNLEQRLGPILTQVPADTQAKRTDQAPRQVNGGLATSIAEANEDLEQLVHWVNNINSRLEL